MLRELDYTCGLGESIVCFEFRSHSRWFSRVASAASTDDITSDCLCSRVALHRSCNAAGGWLVKIRAAVKLHRGKLELMMNIQVTDKLVIET